MQYLLAGGLLSAAVLVAAAPQAPPHPTASLAAGSSYRFRFCSKKNFGGSCETAYAASSECVEAQHTSGKISSFEVTAGHSCYLYAEKSCTGTQSRLIENSSENLKDVKFNDKAQSFRCFSSDAATSPVDISAEPSIAVVSAIPEKTTPSGPTCLEVQVNKADKNYPYWSRSLCNHTSTCLHVPESAVNDKISIWSNNAIHCDAFTGPAPCAGAVSQVMQLTPYQQGLIDADNPVNSFKCYERNNTRTPKNHTASIMQPRPTTTVTLQVASPTATLSDLDVHTFPIATGTSSSKMCALLCRDKDLKNQKKGDCDQFCNAEDQCVDILPANLNKKVSSVHADPSMECYLYKDQFCKGDRSEPIYGVVKNLRDMDFNDKAKSFQCFAQKNTNETCAQPDVRMPDADYCVEACRVDDDSMDCWKTCFSPNASEQPKCVSDLPSQLSGKINSLDFDGDALTCHLYSEKKCKGEQSKAIQSDCGNLKSINFDNKAKSFQCFKRPDSDKASVLHAHVPVSAAPSKQARDVTANETSAMGKKKYCIKVFNQFGFQGNSEEYCAHKGKCKTLPAPMKGEISSANASSAASCYLYEDAKCNEDYGRSPVIDYHGIEDLRHAQDINGNSVDFDSKATAFKCWPDEAAHREQSRSTDEIDTPLPAKSQGDPDAGCIEMFKKTDFKGEKKLVCADELDQCREHMPEGWNDKAMSAKASEGFSCTLYEDKECKGKVTRPITSDGFKDLSKMDPKMSKKMTSFKCQRAGSIDALTGGLNPSWIFSQLESMPSMTRAALMPEVTGAIGARSDNDHKAGCHCAECSK